MEAIVSKIKDIVIVGSGNPDIIRLIEDINDRQKTFNILGFLEKAPELIGQRILNYPIIGDDTLLATEFSNCCVVNNVMATTRLHEKITKMIQTSHSNDLTPNLIHPSVNQKYVEFGYGNIIYENVCIGVDASIGSFNIVYQGTLIGHQAKIGSHCLFAASTIGARATIGDRVLFGNRSMVIPSKSICDDSFIGAGSVVVRSIKRPKAVFGNPAKELYPIDPES